jgi:hypothetical protein
MVIVSHEGSGWGAVRPPVHALILRHGVNPVTALQR